MIRIQEDTYKHKGLRKRLIDEIRQKGIQQEKVLKAMNNVPRHFFLDPAFDKIAYEDRAFPIDSNQTISQPYTVAFQTELLDVQLNERVLEIGTGSAYQASVLAELGAHVFTIERQKILYDKNILHYPLRSVYKSIKFFYGDGFAGLPTFAPFDKILITAAAPFVPEKLVEQLKSGGVMVLPLNEGEHQTMTRIRKLASGDIQQESFHSFQFVPMLGGREQ